MSATHATMLDDWSTKRKVGAFVEFWGRAPLVEAVRFSDRSLYVSQELSIADEMRMVEDAVRAGICHTKPHAKLTDLGWRLACRMAS